MRIEVSAKPRSMHDRIEKLSDTHYKVMVKEPPIGGRANRAIVKLLAEYFSVAEYQVKIVSGMTSREKVVEIMK